MFKWLKESSRLKHLIYAIPIGFIFSMICVIGVASGLEYKDYLYGNKWDWLDWIATLIGGLVGQVLQLLFIYLIL